MRFVSEDELIIREIIKIHDRVFKEPAETVDITERDKEGNETWCVNDKVFYKIIDTDWDEEKWDVQFKIEMVEIGHLTDEEVS